MTAPVAILGGVRTPFGKAGGALRSLATEDLGAIVTREVLARVGLRASLVDALIAGNVGQPAGAQNVGRVIALLAGLPNSVPGVTVHRNCASGLEAVVQAADLIRLGRASIVVAVGVESMSNYPIHFNDRAAAWFARMARSKSMGAKLSTFAAWRPSFLSPVPAILKGLKDPVSGLGMGEATERVAREWGVTRLDCDAYAVDSNLRAAKARERLAEEIVPVATSYGVLSNDEGVRPDSSPAALARLTPRFDRRLGMLTAGNSSQVSDGAVAVVLASDAAITTHRLTPLGYLGASHVAALEPERFALGPLLAIAGLHPGRSIPWDRYDRVEINEAFAAQILVGLRAAADPEFARMRLSLPAALGAPPLARLNQDGGAIAIGHPVGASGARLVLNALMGLKRDGGERALVSLCVGGGLGMAAVLASTPAALTQHQS